MSPSAASGGSSAAMILGSNGMREILARKIGELTGFFPFVIQNPPQRGQAVKDARLYGAQGAFQNLGNLFVAESLAEAEDERLPLAVGKLGDSGPKALFPFLHFAHGVSAWPTRRLGCLRAPQDAQLSPV